MASSAAAAAPFDRTRLGHDRVQIDRGFVRVGYGQLHYRRAAPTDQAQATRPPVVCFHQTPNSSQVYVEFMAALATDRVVYAVDTPGLGESDLPRTPPEIADYAQAMAEFLDRCELGPVDIVGYHTGASIASELAALRPDDVRRMVLVGLALFNAEEREAFFAEPWPRQREADGRHLLSEWQRSHSWRGPGQSDASIERTFIEKISAGNTAWWGARAVFRHDLAAAMQALDAPTLVINPNDDLHEITTRLGGVRADIDIVPIEDYGFGVFEVQATELADIVRGHFDRG